jgi:hypothetical protein
MWVEVSSTYLPKITEFPIKSYVFNSACLSRYALGELAVKVIIIVKKQKEESLNKVQIQSLPINIYTCYNPTKFLNNFLCTLATSSL